MVAKPVKTKGKIPISRHPLFVPMVALWFATLFGLGSLAIRPTLLESFVLALRLDLVIPAAAPPLGFTFRILLALMLFVMGGALGFALGRRFTRPAQAASASNRFARKTTAQAPARAAAHNEGPDDDDFARLESARQSQLEAAEAGPARRRSLALEEDFSTDYNEFVPLPGGEPQILDLADLGPISTADDMEIAASASAVPNDVQPQEMVQFAPQPAERQVFQAPVAANPEPQGEVEPDFDPWRRHPEPARVEFQPAPVSAEAPPQSVQFVPQPDFSRPEPASFAAPEQNFAPPAAFSPPPVESADAFVPAADVQLEAAQHYAEPAAPVFAAPSPEVPVAASFAAEPASETPAPARADFTVPASEPLFERKPVDAAEPAATVYFPNAVTDMSVLASEPEMPPVAAPIDFANPEPVQFQPEAGEPVDAAREPSFGELSGDAADRLVASPIGSLGVVQLAERLALAIARKRDVAAPSASTQAIASAAFAAPSPPVPVPSPLPPIMAAPVSPAFAPAFAAESVGMEVQSEGASFGVEAQAAEVPETVSAANFTTQAIPAALRPLSFDDADDEDVLDTVVPPRSFAMPAPHFAAPVAEPAFAPPVPVAFEPPAPAPAFDQVAAFAAPHESAGTVESAGSELPDDGYASLLGMKTQNRPFVRIEEPVQENAAIEPVVIFPGQDSRPTIQPPQSGLGGGNGELRQFDAPPAVSAPLAAPAAPANGIDPQETERQLKAALATLQRMSGAA